MIRYRQRVYADPRRTDGADTNGIPGDCLRACVAALLDAPYDTVPHFGLRRSWWEAMRRWVREHHNADFAPLVPVDGTVRPFLAVAPDIMVGVGGSPRRLGRRHAVLLDPDLRLVHDPHPSDAGLAYVDGVYALTAPYWPPPAQLALTGSVPVSVGAGRVADR